MAAPHVYVYHSGQPNIPQLTAAGGAGQLHDLMYAIGVTGFGSVTLDSLTRSGTTATATRAAGLGLADGMPALYADGPPSIPHIIEISGSSNGWDGQYSLSAVPGSTACTFTVPDTLATPATGTITIKRAPAGMARLSNASNKSVWQFSDTLTMPGYLMLDDSNAGYAGVRLAEGYAGSVAYDNMSGLCPTVAQQSGIGAYWRKTDGSGSAARPFLAVVWKGGIWLCIGWSNNALTGLESGYAGACLTRKSGDAYPGILIASTANNASYYHASGQNFMSKNAGTQNGQWLQRSSSQAGSALVFTKIGNSFGSNIGGIAGSDQSNIVEGGADDIHGPIHICEGSAAGSSAQRDRRGIMPGLWDPLCASGRANLDVLYGMTNLSGRRVVLVKTQLGSSSVNAFFALDLDGPYALADY